MAVSRRKLGLISRGDDRLLEIVTANATPTELRNGSGLERFLVPTNTTLAFDGLIAARRTDGGAAESAAYTIAGCIKNDAGTVALVGTPTVNVLGENNSAWAVAVTADNTNKSLAVTVTGAAASTIIWKCSLRVTTAL